MQLTRFTDYSLRVLLFVGRQRRTHLHDGRDRSVITAFRWNTCARWSHKLAKLGYLNSSRGRGGGLVLGRDPAAIRIGDVILAMEKDMSIVDCHALDCRAPAGLLAQEALDRGRPRVHRRSRTR